MDKTPMATDRLLIRRFLKTDYQALYDYLSLPEVVRYEPYHVFTLAECRREVKERARHPAFWAVCLKDSDRLIGNLYFILREPEHYHTWELGYVLHPDYQGNGYATEAAKKILEYGFLAKRAHRIIARCNPLNAASWHLLERIGMRREMCAVKAAWFKYDEHGEPLWHDTLQYAILEEEWLSRNIANQP